MHTARNTLVAVITRYNFDSEVSVVLKKSREEAEEYLLKIFNEEVRIDTEKNGYDTISTIDLKEGVATITNRFDDRDDVTTYELTESVYTD